ncbi:hypothetical protein P9D28_11050 [Bacillus haynesii]|uniref:hypothetical protein n=1 Tax=Bacillus haynesii TaxID=1925021 RepID=UPI002DBDEEDA|nr:hypothetical protein [Bacillus haynesii]MEC1552966.1 hypothetical protein [Bacillus haynesii]
MFISINRPNDETRTILQNLLNEGLPITLWEDDDPSFEQKKKKTLKHTIKFPRNLVSMQ